MTARTFGSPSFEVRHYPDYSMEPDGSGGKQRVELPGKVHLGVVVDGAFWPIAERKAAGLFADIERAKQSQQEGEQQQQSGE